MRYRPIFYFIGLMTLGLGGSMLACAFADIVSDEPTWRVFLSVAILSIATGGAMAVATREKGMSIGRREAFLLTAVSWIVLVFVAATPFMVGFGMSFTDAMFESMSGLTTTGATVISGLDDLPKSIILWRALLQWYGGIGIIVTAIAVLPSLRVGGMQLFHMESSDQSDKFLPSTGQIALQSAVIYAGLTAVCAGFYRVFGMNDFQAMTLAMTTLATGGFAHTDASFHDFVPGGADIVAIVFMCIGSLPLILYVRLLHGDWRAWRKDPQPWVWLSIAAIASVIMGFYIQSQGVMSDNAGHFRMAAFNVVSVLSGTGYGTEDFAKWGSFASALFVILMFLGGTAGSASCGLKTFRVHVAVKTMLSYARLMVRPHQVSPVRYAGEVVSEDTLQSIMLFMFLYFAAFAVIASGIALTDVDTETALSAAAATLNNVGPGLGDVGPATTFDSLDDAAKWLCFIAMLLGRLELIAIFVIFAPTFWRS